jgi:hypothetical protein
MVQVQKRLVFNVSTAANLKLIGSMAQLNVKNILDFAVLGDNWGCGLLKGDLLNFCFKP